MTTGTATLPDASTALLNMVPDETARLWLGRLSRQLPFLSDLIPADLTIYATVGDQRLVAIAQAHPTVRESFYEQSAVGTSLDPDPASAIWRGLGANEGVEADEGGRGEGGVLDERAASVVDHDGAKERARTVAKQRGRDWPGSGFRK